MSARLMPCSRAISPSRPRSSAERSRAARPPSAVMSAQRRSSVTCGAGTPSSDARVLEQLRAVLLEAAAAAHLRLDLGELAEHALGVAGADRLALAEHELEQPAGGGDLPVEVGEQLGLEHRVDHAASLRSVA